MLTAKQNELLRFIHERLEASGVSPSFEEMKEALDLKSKSGVHRLIGALEERGFIRRLANRARALEVVKMPEGGGASVGDHDLVQAALKAAGAEIDFWRVAMRPGKPVMAARLGTTVVVGLPGNPSSAFVTAFLFLLPLIRHLAGSTAPYPAVALAPVTTDIPAGDNRSEYVRALLENGRIAPFGKQDSGMITPLVQANAVIVRPTGCPPLKPGELTPYLAL